MNTPVAHFNGQLLPLDRIRISPLDRGFIFGDGVYEVIPVYEGAALRAREHFERLQRSMDEIRLRNPHTVDEWMSLTRELLAHHPGNQSVYIQVTRGPPANRDHVLPKDLAPTVFMMCQPLVSPSREAGTRHRVFHGAGFPLGEVPHQVDFPAGQRDGPPARGRRGRGRDDPGARRLRHRGLGLERVRGEGRARRGPARDNLILLGITYELIVRLAAEGAVALDVRPVAESELRSADEIWLSSSTKEVLAVTSLDGRPVGNGKPGPVFRRMHALYQDYKEEARRQSAVAA